MTKAKSLKRALLSSVLAVVLCFSMLLGTTFAWFTDSVTSSGNVIKSGTLDVQLFQHTGTATPTEITNASAPLFGTDIIWEPGRTQVVYLSIKNNGTLDLKYKVALEVALGANAEDNLAEVMQYAIIRDAQYDSVSAWDDNLGTYPSLGLQTAVCEGNEVEDVILESGDEHFFALAIHMDEEAGNKYMNESITFDIAILAGQLASELDSFGKDYDLYAGYPGTGFAPAITGTQSAAEIPVTNEEGTKIGSIVIPKGAADETVTQYSANIKVVEYDYNFTVDADSEVVTFDISVDGLKTGNTTPVKTQLLIEPGLNPATVKAYHYNDEIPCTYDPNTGYVIFETTTFSPFSIVRDKDSVYVPPVIIIPDGETLPDGFPTALVTKEAQYENVDLPWGSYDAWSPTEGLDAQLEAAYTFKCNETAEEAELNDFAHWYCDFYVKLDKDLGANQIFLGGNYGPFGWVGFHNGELELEANTEIPLLGSVTSNPWTYAQVAASVGEFICGVGDVGNQLSGATFTVMLRLTNPENTNEYYNVATIEYTFTGTPVVTE